MARIVRFALFGVACWVGLLLLLAAPDLIGLIPRNIREYWVELLALSVVAVYARGRRMAGTKFDGSKASKRARLWLHWVDTLTPWILPGGLVVALGLLCAGLLLAWVPHYLTWPWSRDSETFAVLAQSWDHGILPYRDIRGYNFPGATYLAWVLGKVFGWGNTAALYAFDASCLVVLGTILVAWSWRRLDGAIPGLIAYLAFLTYYLNFHFGIVAERDWHTALLVCLALLFMQAWPGPASRTFSALAAALALAVRPHAVLFLPALLWEAAQGAPSEPGWIMRMRAALLWCLWYGVFVAMAFAPLLFAGIADDLWRGLRVAAYGGPYSKATPANVLAAFLDQFRSWRTDIPLAATLLLAAGPRTWLSGMARTWSLAWLGVLVYQPLHPVHHFYALIPIFLVSSITWALAVSWLLSVRGLVRPLRALAVALVIYEIMPVFPIMCDFVESRRALRPLLSGEIPTVPPIGCGPAYPRLRGSDGRQTRWESYRDVLNYLRSQTAPQTLVANVVNRYPYDSTNGPVGRLSPFLAESGICWMHMVDMDLDPEFAQSLVDSPDSVVVWDSTQDQVESRLELKRVVAVVRQYYEPAAWFDHFEVWRRKSPRAQ
jgi:hypothetical protein